MANKKEDNQWLSKVEFLSEVLPYMHQYNGSSIVIKYGGHAMTDKKMQISFASDIALLQQVGSKPVVVHGGGPQIEKMLNKLNIKTNFVDGLRVTDEDTVNVVEMVLSGAINKSIVAAIMSAGAKAVGISGKDGGLIEADKITARRDPNSAVEKVVDLGFVGRPTKIENKVLDALMHGGLIPVVAPLGLGKDGQTYNINADTVAGAISSSLKAKRMLMLTDVPGVLDEQGKLIEELSSKEAKSLIKNGTITSGMIPKVETCIEAVENGTDAAVILDGRAPHATLMELFTEHGGGTLIRK
jgi:acetylglutamate kinase